MTDDPSFESIDRYIPEDVRAILEGRFWQAVEEASTLEAVSGDRLFASRPEAHPALFGDHGIVHARDVAAGVVELAGTADGRLLPARPADRREFVTALAVLLAYIHDVGMNDPTPQGRRIQALHAAQIPFSGAMDDVLAILNPDGDLPRRLGANARWYADPTRDSFAWLDLPDSAHRALADDVVDAVRLVRAADALRQRGTTLRTTAGYEIFIDAQTDQAVYSLRTSVGDRLFLLRVDNPVGAGEANLRKAELTPNEVPRGFRSASRASCAGPSRNSTVVAAESGEVLMIPGELFAREWFRPYEQGEFVDVLAEIAG